jgi:hypothetical protein
MNVLQERIAELAAYHGSIRDAAAVLQVDHSYLYRLSTGEKDDPGDILLKRLKLRRIVSYERIGQPAPAVQEPAAIYNGHLYGGIPDVEFLTEIPVGTKLYMAPASSAELAPASDMDYGNNMNITVGDSAECAPAPAVQEPVGTVDMQSGSGDRVKWTRWALPHGTKLYVFPCATPAPADEWVMVPRNPTKEMLIALYKDATEIFESTNWVKACEAYRAAIVLAPAVPAMPDGHKTIAFDQLLSRLESMNFDPNASHVHPKYRDGYNRAIKTVIELLQNEDRFIPTPHAVLLQTGESND